MQQALSPLWLTRLGSTTLRQRKGSSNGGGCLSISMRCTHCGEGSCMQPFLSQQACSSTRSLVAACPWGGSDVHAQQRRILPPIDVRWAEEQVDAVRVERRIVLWRLGLGCAAWNCHPPVDCNSLVALHPGVRARAQRAAHGTILLRTLAAPAAVQRPAGRGGRGHLGLAIRAPYTPAVQACSKSGTPGGAACQRGSGAACGTGGAHHLCQSPAAQPRRAACSLLFAPTMLSSSAPARCRPGCCARPGCPENSPALMAHLRGTRRHNWLCKGRVAQLETQPARHHGAQCAPPHIALPWACWRPFCDVPNCIRGCWVRRKVQRDVEWHSPPSRPGRSAQHPPLDHRLLLALTPRSISVTSQRTLGPLRKTYS